jgi:hypothetical protein
MKGSISQIKNSVEIFINRLDWVEGRLSGFEGKIDELEYSENNKGLNEKV